MKTKFGGTQTWIPSLTHTVVTGVAQASSVGSGQGTRFKVEGVGHTTLYFHASES